MARTRELPLAAFGTDPAAAPLSCSAGSLFGPRGVCAAPDGAIWIADTGHHRLLSWQPGDAQASLCLGQPGWAEESPNAGADPGPCSFHMPVGLCRVGERGLAVADSWNHRVLIWHQAPSRPGQGADLVLGQSDFSGGLANRGGAPAADSLFWPSGLYCDAEIFAVADAGNRRVLIWNGLPQANGEPAGRVLGQTDFSCRDQAAGQDLDRAGMVWPHALACRSGEFVIADAGASRLMLFDTLPDDDGAACDRLTGQSEADGRLPNRGLPRPAADRLAMPYAIAIWREWLLVADTANSRLLGWLAGDEEASWLHGQPDFEHGGDNRWLAIAADSLCWPYGLAVEGDRLLVADTGNNRVQIWDLRELFDGR